MRPVFNYLNDFFALFYPQLCASCNTNLYNNETVICTSCRYRLPYTQFHSDPDNRTARQLAGRFPFEAAASFLYFHKGSRVQNLIHQLKYNSNTDVGTTLGEMYGQVLRSAEKFSTADIIVPVPLHPAKLKKRGYNQSEYFARGLASAMEISHANALMRLVNTQSQTRKSRYVRYENMKDIFSVRSPDILENKHVLLVDDVLTSGATVEACALKILEITGTRISIATIAFTD
ncbi:ComF family protein [Pedobacter sp. BS3]|nr:ComF family protein [Pedobacter sp. BS3]